MHNDEFELLGSGEMNICENTIKRIKKTLGIFERKHGKTTDTFIAELKTGKLTVPPDLKDDYESWENSYESLKKWEELEREYEARPRKRNI